MGLALWQGGGEREGRVDRDGAKSRSGPSKLKEWGGCTSKGRRSIISRQSPLKKHLRKGGGGGGGVGGGGHKSKDMISNLGHSGKKRLAPSRGISGQRLEGMVSIK